MYTCIYRYIIISICSKLYIYVQNYPCKVSPESFCNLGQNFIYSKSLVLQHLEIWRVPHFLINWEKIRVLNWRKHNSIIVCYIYIRIFLGVFSMYSIMWYHMFVCVKMWYSQNPVLLFIILFLLVHGQHMVVKLPFSDTSLVSSHYPTRIPNKIPIVVAEKPSFFQDYPIILMWKFSCFLDKSSLSYGFPMVFLWFYGFPTVFLWWTPPCFAGSSVWISV